MRVLIIAQQWEPEEGTPQRRWAPLVDGLVSAGHSVDVIAPPPHYPGGTLSSQDPAHQVGAVARGRHGELIWRCNFSPHTQSLRSRIWDQGHTLLSSVELGSKIIRRNRPDILLVTAPPVPTIYAPIYLGWRYRIPYVVDLRDAWPDLLKYVKDWNSELERISRGSAFFRKLFGFAASLLGRLLNYSLRRAQGIVTTTPSFAEKLRRNGYKNVVSIRNLGSVFPGPVADRNEREPGKLRVLYIGTTGRAQGLENAIKAVKLTQAQGVNLKLRVIGTGASISALKEQAKGTGIEFRGRIPHSEVPAHYQWADTSLVHLKDWGPLEYCVPSKFYEALSSGRHVTVSVNGETARIINENGAGISVEAMNPQALADAWIALARSPELLDVQNKGRRWLTERESPEENSRKFTEFVERCAQAQA